MLDYSSDENLWFDTTLKQRSASITFSNNQLLSKPAEYNVLLLFVAAIYTHLLFMTMHFRSKQNITQGNYAWISIE